MFFEIGHPGRADLPSTNEVDIQLYACLSMRSPRPVCFVLQSSFFVLYICIAQLTLPLPRSGRPSVKKTNGLSLLHVPFEIGQPGRADLPSKNEVDVLALPYVHIPTAASLED